MNEVELDMYKQIGFNKLQLAQIKYGLQKKIDVSIYAKKQYSS